MNKVISNLLNNVTLLLCALAPNEIILQPTPALYLYIVIDMGQSIFNYIRRVGDSTRLRCC